MSDVLVVNASPLIFLGNAGRLDLLRVLGATRVVVPQPVFDEVIYGGYTDKAARALSDTPWLEQRPSPSVPDSITAWEIGKGESSVIATALQESDTRVVIRRHERQEVRTGARPVCQRHPGCGHRGVSPGTHRRSAPGPAGVAGCRHVVVRRGDRACPARCGNRLIGSGPRPTSKVATSAITQLPHGRAARRRGQGPKAGHVHAGGAKRRALTAPSTARASNA